MLIRPDRHLRQWRVRDLGERLVEPFGRGPLLGFGGRDAVAQTRHLGHQGLRLGLILRALGLADLTRQQVAAFLGRLRRADRRLALIVERDEALRFGGEAASREPPVENRRILPDPADIVHLGFRNCRRHPTIAEFGLSALRSLLFGLVPLLLDHADRDDAALIEDQGREREGEHRESVGRREHRRYAEDDHDRIAALALQESRNR